MELADVLARKKFARRLVLTKLPPDELAARYGDLATVVRPVATPRVAPDPDDDVVIGTALAAKAAMVVTGDRTLLGVLRYETVEIVSMTAVMERAKL